MSELEISGDIAKPARLTHDDLTAFADEALVPDIGTLGSSRAGGGVRIADLIRKADPQSGVRYVSFISRSDNFRVCVPLDQIAPTGIVIHHISGTPMTRAQGGPFRFIIPDPAACGTDIIDECVNVKFLDEIRLTREPGEDTRPENEAEHARLHEREHSAEN